MQGTEAEGFCQGARGHETGPLPVPTTHSSVLQIKASAGWWPSTKPPVTPIQLGPSDARSLPHLGVSKGRLLPAEEEAAATAHSSPAVADPRPGAAQAESVQAPTQPGLG